MKKDLRIKTLYLDNNGSKVKNSNFKFLRSLIKNHWRRKLEMLGRTEEEGRHRWGDNYSIKYLSNWEKLWLDMREFKGYEIIFT